VNTIEKLMPHKMTVSIKTLNDITCSSKWYNSKRYNKEIRPIVN